MQAIKWSKRAFKRLQCWCWWLYDDKSLKILVAEYNYYCDGNMLITMKNEIFENIEFNLTECFLDSRIWNFLCSLLLKKVTQELAIFRRCWFPKVNITIVINITNLSEISVSNKRSVRPGSTQMWLSRTTYSFQGIPV